MAAVTKRQVENAKATLLRALEEGYDPRAMTAGLDVRFNPPVWKVLLPRPEGHVPMLGLPADSVSGRALKGE